MSTAREVVAQALADLIGDEITEGDRRLADAVLAALRAHWTSEEVNQRIAAATGYESMDEVKRFFIARISNAVIAALFDEEAR